MAFLIRKFSRAKWDSGKCPPCTAKDLGADALTSCLRTYKNTLSVWATDSPKWGDFDSILAALFVSSDGPAKADVVLLDEKSIKDIEGVDLVKTSAATPAKKEVNERHRDIANLTLSRMESVAEEVLKELNKNANGNVKRYTQTAVLNLVYEEVVKGNIDTDKLPERWVSSLEDKKSKLNK